LLSGASVGHAAKVQFDDSDRADESQVEDRRGARFPGGRVGAGVGGLGLVGGAIYLALQLLASGANHTAGQIGRIIYQSQRRAQVDPETPPSRLPAGPSGSCRRVDSKNDPAKFVVCVESNVQAFWRRQLSGRGSGYHPSKLVLFSDATYSGCGTASSSSARRWSAWQDAPKGFHGGAERGRAPMNGRSTLPIRSQASAAAS
jgi:predicted metalloprotease